MTKSEDALPPAKRKILQQQQRAMKWLQDGFQSDAKDAVAEILEVAKQVAPRRK
jgi:hypothetical protein